MQAISKCVIVLNLLAAVFVVWMGRKHGHRPRKILDDTWTAIMPTLVLIPLTFPVGKAIGLLLYGAVAAGALWGMVRLWRDQRAAAKRIE